MLDCYSTGLLKVSKSCLIEQSKVSQDFEIQSLVVLTNSIQKVHIIHVNANMYLRITLKISINETRFVCGGCQANK